MVGSATHSSIVDDCLDGYGAKIGTLVNTSKQRPPPKKKKFGYSAYTV